MSRSHVSLLVLSFLLIVVGCKKDDKLIHNKVPAVDAGPSQTITLSDSVILTGSASDSDGHVVAYLWSLVSGPASANIVNPGSATTTVKFDTKGSYLFQLMATDDLGATGVDTVRVTVNPIVAKTVTIQPNNNPNEFCIVTLNGNDVTGLTISTLEATAWTGNGDPYTWRGIVKFDLSSIPSKATITSANLYLYSHPSPPTGDKVHANSGSANAMYVSQVTSSWSPSSIGWYNQPSVSTSNQVFVPSTSQYYLDLNLDVTSMVASMVNNNANYGFFLQLQNEVIYNSRIFVASHNTSYPDKHPKLVISYQ